MPQVSIIKLFATGLALFIVVILGNTLITSKNALPEKTESNDSNKLIRAYTDTDGDGLEDWEELLIEQSPEKVVTNNSSDPDNSFLTKISEIIETAPSLPLTLPTESLQASTYPLLDRDSFNINKSGLATYGDFYNAYSKITTEVTFPQTEITFALTEGKEGGGRVLTLEELMQLELGGTVSEKITRTLLMWADLDKRMADVLQELAVTGGVVDAPQELASWFAYHGQMAERFTKPDLELSEMQKLAKEYEVSANAHLKAFSEKITKAEKQDPTSFTLVNRAEAFTCGAFRPPNFYHFGGRVAYYLPCNWGIVETITPPCGGIFLFTYAGMAANPFLWKYGPYVIADAILGRSLVIPGICILGVPPAAAYFPYEAIVIFYGAAAAPGI
ncbi:MAG: hypothetical protein AAB590_00010 [Patescibacteria group bacterium]